MVARSYMFCFWFVHQNSNLTEMPEQRSTQCYRCVCCIDAILYNAGLILGTLPSFSGGEQKIEILNNNYFKWRLNNSALRRIQKLKTTCHHIRTNNNRERRRRLHVGYNTFYDSPAVHCSDRIFNRIRREAPSTQERATITLGHVPSLTEIMLKQ